MDPTPPGTNTLSPWRFVVGFGVVSLLGDATYEGARSILGPFLAHLGASALLVGLITGGGEAVSTVLRLASGPLADRRSRRWKLTISGYAVNVIAVPLLALANAVWSAGLLVFAERSGKAMRAPARDSLLADAGTVVGQGKAFAVHEAMDQTGALAGPLLVSALLVAGSSYHAAFAVLAVPAAALLVVVAWLRRRVPDPDTFSGRQRTSAGHQDALSFSNLPARYFWYLGFAGLTMLGYATFGVLSYHLAIHHIVTTAEIPLVYAAAMGTAAVVALAGGQAYTRIGLRSLVVLPVMAAIVPYLSFARSAGEVWAGAVVWGGAMGLHESTMRAAVADLVPAELRGRAYGLFGAGYGMMWLGGGAVIGALYDVSIPTVRLFVTVVEVVALVAAVPLMARPAKRAT